MRELAACYLSTISILLQVRQPRAKPCIHLAFRLMPDGYNDHVTDATNTADDGKNVVPFSLPATRYQEASALLPDEGVRHLVAGVGIDFELGM